MMSDLVYDTDDQIYVEGDNENSDSSHELTEMVREERPKWQPNQETETINLGTDDDKKEVKINTHFFLEEKKELVDLLTESQDVFLCLVIQRHAWD